VLIGVIDYRALVLLMTAVLTAAGIYLLTREEQRGRLPDPAGPLEALYRSEAPDAPS